MGKEGLTQKEFVYMIEETFADCNVEILEESSQKSNRGGLKFKTILQEAEVPGNNTRLYRKNSLVEGLERVSPRVKAGSFYGELDHPKTESPARFAAVMLGNASHRFLDFNWNGNILEATGQTLSTRVGKDMRALIEDDGIKVGFSLRALGKTKQLPNGLIEVSGNVNVITYDCVSNPSFSNALLQTAITEENVKELLMEKSDRLKLLSEAEGIELELLGENHNLSYDRVSGIVQFCSGNKCIKTHLEEHIIESYNDVMRKLFS